MKNKKCKIRREIMKMFIFLSAVLIFCFSGCASIVSGSNQDVRISSSPDNADIVIYDRYNMKVWDASTPAVVNLKRSDGFFSGATYRLEITKEGYEKQTIQISPTLNGGWYGAGNCCIGGLIGWVIVDPLTGAMWILRPETVSANLRQNLSLNENEDIYGIYVVLKEQIPVEIFNTLDLIRLD